MVRAMAPVIISASRSTDIPAFYSDWLIRRIKLGYVKWKNPFNGAPSYVSFENARLFVFWTKNPEPMLQYLPFLERKGYGYYFQFTLNDYDNEKFEPGVPDVGTRIETFQKLSVGVGKEKVIWRFDPLILTDRIGVDELLKKMESVGDQLKDYTHKLVFSFADVGIYKKVQRNLCNHAIAYREFDEKAMNEFAAGLQKLNEKWDFEIGTCCEKINLDRYGIIHNKCIDDNLIARLFPNDKRLMEFLGVRTEQSDLFSCGSDFNSDSDYGSICSLDCASRQTVSKRKSLKDKGQRADCGCITSKDIGQYNTCPHECVYCYANTSTETVRKNYERHKKNPNRDTITGE